MKSDNANETPPHPEHGSHPQLDAAPGYVVAGGGPLEVGKEYQCRNERKGTFRMKITALNGEWITGIITYGVAKAIMSYNVRDAGEEVTVRDVHSYFVPITT